MNFEQKYYKYKLKYLKLKGSIDLNDQNGGFTDEDLDRARQGLKKTAYPSTSEIESERQRQRSASPPPPPPPPPSVSPVANIPRITTPPVTTTPPTSTNTVTNVYHYVPTTQTRLLYPTYTPGKIYYDVDYDLSKS